MAILYNLKVLEGALTGVGDSPQIENNVLYTPAEMNAQLAQAEKWYLTVRVTQGAGTSPTITVKLQHSNDNVNWADKTTLLSAQAIATSSIATYTANDLGTSNVGGAFMRLRFYMGGTSPSCTIQAWLCGRSND